MSNEDQHDDDAQAAGTEDTTEDTGDMVNVSYQFPAEGKPETSTGEEPDGGGLEPDDTDPDDLSGDPEPVDI